MLEDMQLSALRKTPRIGYYFRYPLYRKDFREIRKHDRICGHYAAKPLYGRLTKDGHVDKSAGFNGDVAALFIPMDATRPDQAELFLAHTDPKRLILSNGRKNREVIYEVAEQRIKRALEER